MECKCTENVSKLIIMKNTPAKDFQSGVFRMSYIWRLKTSQTVLIWVKSRMTPLHLDNCKSIRFYSQSTLKFYIQINRDSLSNVGKSVARKILHFLLAHSEWGSHMGYEA